MEVTQEGLARFFEVVQPNMNELQRWVVAGVAAEMFGRAGVAVRPRWRNASGMSRNTVINRCPAPAPNDFHGEWDYRLNAQSKPA